MKQLEKELREWIGTDIERETFDNSAHKTLARVLSQRYTGKKLTKRIEKQWAEQFLPPAMRERAIVRYGEDYGLCQLSAWAIPHHETFDKRLVMFIAHKGEKSENFQPETFENNDCCHGTPAEKRNEFRKTLCQNGELEKIARLVTEIEFKREELKSLLEFEKPGQQVEYHPRVYAAANARQLKE